MAPRLHYRRHNHYATGSNRVRRVRTPGARVVYHNVGKQASRPKCGSCHRPLPGIPALAPHKMKLLKKRKRTVHRAYGGSRCHTCVRERQGIYVVCASRVVAHIAWSYVFVQNIWRKRIMRAFLVEEQKCVKQVLQVKEKQKKEESKAEAKRSKPKKQSSKTAKA